MINRENAYLGYALNHPENPERKFGGYVSLNPEVEYTGGATITLAISKHEYFGECCTSYRPPYSYREESTGKSIWSYP